MALRLKHAPKEFLIDEHVCLLVCLPDWFPAPRVLSVALRCGAQLFLAPAGTYKVQGMLQQGGMGCANGGVTGVFTPMYLAVCRKPL